MTLGPLIDGHECLLNAVVTVSQKSADGRMATEAAWLKRNRLMERRKRKCALTSTGLLVEGVDHTLASCADYSMVKMAKVASFECFVGAWQ